MESYERLWAGEPSVEAYSSAKKREKRKLDAMFDEAPVARAQPSPAADLEEDFAGEIVPCTSGSAELFDHWTS